MEVGMKKLIVAAILAVFMVIGAPLFAQDQQNKNDKFDDESEFYYVNVTLEKIYPYHAGYVVQYRKTITSSGTAYLPIEWFTRPATRGEIITLPEGRVWPSLTVYYKNGEFSHVRLYVHKSYSHPTWGNIPLGVNIDDRFDKDADDLKLY
jgi:hypothetical protein